jgi:hypothetical protein
MFLGRRSAIRVRVLGLSLGSGLAKKKVKSKKVKSKKGGKG